MIDCTNPFTAKHRTHQIVFETAYERHETATFSFPKGWNMTSVPSDTAFHNNVGSCSIEFIQTDGKLTISRSFALNHPVWEVEDYPEVRALFQAREDISLRPVQLKDSSP